MGQSNLVMPSGALLGRKQASAVIGGGGPNTWTLELPPSHTLPPIKQLGAEAALIGSMAAPAAQGPPLHQQPFSSPLTCCSACP